MSLLSSGFHLVSWSCFNHLVTNHLGRRHQGCTELIIRRGLILQLQQQTYPDALLSLVDWRGDALSALGGLGGDKTAKPMAGFITKVGAKPRFTSFSV